jgi:hypothetical protein
MEEKTPLKKKAEKFARNTAKHVLTSMGLKEEEAETWIDKQWDYIEESLVKPYVQGMEETLKGKFEEGVEIE